MANGAGAARWTITSQAQTTQPDATGKFATGVLIHFATQKGNQGSVFVPEAGYNPQNVAAMVQAKADTMDAVSALGS
jgi:hypothetical protein